MSEYVFNYACINDSYNFKKLFYRGVKCTLRTKRNGLAEKDKCTYHILLETP